MPDNAENYPRPAGGWIKYEGNPIFGNAETGTCFDVDVQLVDGRYRMYFSWRPKASIAYIESDDGVHWNDSPQIVLEPDPRSGWEDNINRTCVVRLKERAYMWYTGQARGFSRIGCAVSDDGGKTFRRFSNLPVMIPELPWEKESVMNPYVLFDSKRRIFRMWYAAGETFEPNALGYAESEDALVWKKSPLNPIFIHGREPYDQARAGGCEVVPDPDTGRYYMFYIGYYDIDTAGICAAYSPDGITGWTRLKSNPVVSPDPGSWDGDACYKPSVIRDEAENCWKLWYNGRTGSREYIGMARHDGLKLE